MASKSGNGKVVSQTGITAFIEAIRPVGEDACGGEAPRGPPCAHAGLAGQIELARVMFPELQYLGPENGPNAQAVREEWQSLWVSPLGSFARVSTSDSQY
ncbi:hypothetical protein [Streptomyces sp. NPDC005336]|uniref:hypothetical protein n=1 Tax=Streptomyces sp. NPDC005336 TaxID=3157035 RepID=UPI0033A96DD6